MQKQFKYCSRCERGYNSPEPLADEIINPSDQVFNSNSSETLNLGNMTNEVPAQDSNDENKNKENENVCPQSIKLKDNIFQWQPFINEWFRLGTSARIIPLVINSLETLHPYWDRNNNS